ncbi:MAG: transcriptional activator, TenA family [Frankiales bacterium]|nr:transcriptional activator, TenA family [Frankiales bacterium]
MSLSARLWAGSADQAAEALAHPFVRGLSDGSLPRPVFQAYVAQDAFFLECFARAYGLALARSTDRASLEVFADLIAGVRDELRLHGGYAAQWGVDMTGVQPVPATSAYTDFLLATASLGGVGLTCAAMTPCLRLYAHLGQSLDPDAAGPYAAWVRTYADPAFEQLAASLEQLLDRHAEDSPGVAAAYRRAMNLELAFFSAALPG